MPPPDHMPVHPPLPPRTRKKSAQPGYRARAATDQSLTTCLFCRDPILEQEPIIVVEHDRERETNLAREPGLAGRARGLMVHTRCAPPGWQSSG